MWVVFGLLLWVLSALVVWSLLYAYGEWECREERASDLPRSAD